MVQDQVEKGRLSPASAHEVSKLADLGEQAEVAARVVAEGLTRADTLEAVPSVRQKAQGRGAVGTKGRGAGKGKVKTIGLRTIRTAGGLKVRVEGRKAGDPAEVGAALEESMTKVRTELEDRQVTG